MTVPGNLSSPLLATAAAADAAAAGPIKSLRFNHSDSAYLERNFGSTGNQRTFTISLWFKNTLDSNGQRTFFTAQENSPLKDKFTKLWLSSSHTLHFDERDGGSDIWELNSTAVFRDPSAWYHLVARVDTTQSTAADRVRLYVNNTQIEDFSSAVYPSQNALVKFVNVNNAKNFIGRYLDNSYEYLDAYVADFYFIDGLSLDPTSFGAFDDNGVWQAAVYSGTYGTNGFHLLDFASESTVGHDSSGNENDFTANNISTTAGAGNDVLFDVPTNGSQSDTGAGGEVSGNYCVLNPLTSSNYTLSNGNLEVDSGSGGNRLLGTIGVSSGKYYFEAVFNSHTSSNDSSYLVVRNEDGFEAGIRNRTADIQYFTSSGGNLGDYSTSNWSTSETHGFALDCDNNQLKIYKNNTLTATISITAGKTYFPGYFRDGSNGSFTFNFGARAFTYTAPSGFKALCTTNLPTPTIADGSDYFETKLYTGNGGTNAITGLGFSPSWVWIKSRANAGSAHFLSDVIRGGTKVIKSDSNDAEFTRSNHIQSFDSNGFTLGADGTSNLNNDSLVAWCWSGGSSTVSNTDGSVTSSVRASQTAGFSVVSYTATGSNLTVGHGLNATPAVIITKDRSAAKDWLVMHESIGVDHFLKLNLTQAKAGPYTNVFTSVSSTTFGTGNDAGINTNGNNRIAYCFAPVAGYSAFGSYTGNASQDGPFVYCGFRPAFILWKRSDAGANWYIQDSARTSFNPANGVLRPNTTDAELTSSQGQIMDALSNGFRVKNNGTEHNDSGGTYVWACFAENPFQANGGLAR